MSARSARSAGRGSTFFESLGLGLPVKEAARNAGYQRSRVYQWRRDDTVFAGEWELAQTMAADLLEEEADRRGCQGIEVPFYRNGEVVGTKLKYSDSLLIVRLKALRPELYRGR